jgi:hypothetical protein
VANCSFAFKRSRLAVNYPAEFSFLQYPREFDLCLSAELHHDRHTKSADFLKEFKLPLGRTRIGLNVRNLWTNCSTLLLEFITKQPCTSIIMCTREERQLEILPKYLSEICPFVLISARESAPSDLQKLVPNGKLNQFAKGYQLKFVHDVGAMYVNCLHTDMKENSDLPVCPPRCQ